MKGAYPFVAFSSSVNDSALVIPVGVIKCVGFSVPGLVGAVNSIISLLQ